MLPATSVLISAAFTGTAFNFCRRLVSLGERPSLTPPVLFGKVHFCSTDPCIATAWMQGLGIYHAFTKLCSFCLGLPVLSLRVEVLYMNICIYRHIYVCMYVYMYIKLCNSSSTHGRVRNLGRSNWKA